MEKSTNKGLEFRELKRFGISISAGMIVLFFIGRRYFPLWLKVAILFLASYHFLFALFCPALLKISFFIFSKVFYFFADFFTKFVLIIFFYFVFTPVAFILRLLGMDEIGKTYKNPGWKDIPDDRNDPSRIEKLY